MNCRVAATFENIFKDLSVSRVCNLESAKAFFMEEIWKDIPGYEGHYQVSDQGRVKSLDRVVSLNRNFRNGNRKSKGKILKGRPNKRGYLRVVLSGKDFRVHQLVAMAFLNHKPKGMEVVVDHINGVKDDNRLENLRLVTQRENCKPNKLTSKYTGVHFCKYADRYISKIFINGKSKYLGKFEDEYQAHLAYKKALENIV